MILKHSLLEIDYGKNPKSFQAATSTQEKVQVSLLSEGADVLLELPLRLSDLYSML
jgi:hypothetical protein